jgi:hypothetical protein
MFEICRDYLVDIAKNKVKIPNVKLKPQILTGGRACSIFTLPARNRLAFTLDHQASRIWKWRDPSRLNGKGEPTIMERLIAAEMNLNFRVILVAGTVTRVEQDFQNFIRNISKTIYDGTEATYLDEAGQTVKDTKGNVIYVQLNNFDFNDNRWYGAHPNKVIMDIEFRGAIYHPDQEMNVTLVPATYVAPQVTNVNTTP